MKPKLGNKVTGCTPSGRGNQHHSLLETGLPLHTFVSGILFYVISHSMSVMGGESWGNASSPSIP